MLSLRRSVPRQRRIDTASSNMVDPQMEKMLHPRPYAPRRTSATTSFSSIYIDEPSSSSTYSDPVWEHEEWDLHEDSPGSSTKYANSDNDEWPLPAPPRSYSVGQAIPMTPISRGKRPVRYSYNGHESNRGFKQMTTRVPRKAVLLKQSLVSSDSARSSVRSRSHLNEVELVDYGNVDGGL
jgi:hypothetical protein